jgi:hypothetical protein
LWRSTTNACPSITEGPDGGYYYVDWNTSNPYAASWCNITALDVNGNFKWNFVVANGSLDLWGIYPDGEVIVYQSVGEIIAISNNGTELWSMHQPLPDASYANSRASDNGTFLIYEYNGSGTYEIGITKDGGQIYIEKVEYCVPYWESSQGKNGTTMYEVRKEFIDNETSVISVCALSMLDGSVEWKTLLHYSDNPDHTMPGVYSLSGTIVDAEGRVFCGDLEDKYSYSLSSSGTILWQKPSLGVMVDTFPSGGLLAWDDSSIKRINPDGSVVWRHYAELDGYSFILLGSDETVYYSYGAEVHALVPSSGLSDGAVFLVILVVVDVVAVTLYGLVRVLKSRRASKT